mgnify:CR=1 FL=1
MSICDLKSYEIVQSRDLSDLSSKGTLLRHKKSGARVLHRRQTVQEYLILWSILYCADQESFR